MKTITVLGNNSGRNAGDNAILGGLIQDFKQAGFRGRFKIPTINTKFIKTTFGTKYVTPVGLMPWNFSIRNLGWPMYKAMTQTDLVLITDNILFDKNFHNPLFNNLKSIAFFSSFCKKKGIPIVFYNASIGPISTQAGAKALQKVLDASPLVITRDTGTKRLIESLSLSHPKILIHADSALNTPILSDNSIQDIIRTEKIFTGPNGTIGLNVNAYIDNWGKKARLSPKSFCEIIAASADLLIEKLDIDILFTVTQIMDIPITKQCMRFIKNKHRVSMIDNSRYNYMQISSIMSKLQMHAGLRTHTLIFAATSGTPMISINAYPKSVAFLETIGMEKWNIDVNNLSVKNLCGLMLNMWEKRDELREYIKTKVQPEKIKARESAGIVMKQFLT